MTQLIALGVLCAVLILLAIFISERQFRQLFTKDEIVDFDSDFKMDPKYFYYQDVDGLYKRRKRTK